MKLIIIALLQLCAFSTFAGGEVGNGGDGSEIRFNDVVQDLRSWIINGGSQYLILPPEIQLDDYNEKMLARLAPYATVVSFSNDKIFVNDAEKTCMNYFDRNQRPNILCNIDRFNETSESGQYQLVHHEFAGLAGMEKNVGTSSDYTISSQLTSYLQPTSILRLEVKRPNEWKEKTHLIKNPKYPGTDIPFNFGSQYEENGICKVLGYEKAVPYSATFGSDNYKTIRVDYNGNIERSVLNRSVDEIVCINKTSNQNIKHITIVSNPRHPESNLPFYFDTNTQRENGVCKVLGYEKAVLYSSSFGSDIHKTIRVDQNGNIERSVLGRPVSEIFCIQ